MAYSRGTVTSSSLLKEVYNPKAFFLHAALLGQAFAHCPIFPTAASRRSLDRFSVPMWPFDLSVRLLIVDLVGRYPTNYLIRREPIFVRIAPLTYKRCLSYASCGISTSFPVLSPSQRQVAHALLTRPPLTFFRSKLQNQFVRLECVKHAASVHPEPGSNSRIKYFTVLGTAIYLFELDSLFLLFPWVSQFVFESCVLLWNLTSSLVRLFDVPCFVFSSFVVQFSRYRSLPLFATAYLVYHTQFRLSRGF